VPGTTARWNPWRAIDVLRAHPAAARRALVGELSTAPRSRQQRPPWPEDLREKVIAGRDRPDGETHPEQLAAYLSKYLTKGTEEFGLDGPGRIYSADDAR
jgi:hypothetical protein